MRGGTQHSFGIHVAKMAGMPNKIVDRANEVLKELEQKQIGKDIGEKLEKMPVQNLQLSMFGMEDPRLEEIKKMLEQMDVNTLTPIEALMRVSEMKRVLEK